MKKLALLTVFLLSACTTTVPVAVIAPKGRVLTGTATASLNGSYFQVSDGRLTCSGSYDGLNSSGTITMPVHCSDGRKGFVTAIREESMTDGYGKVVLSDGTTGDFVFGKAAKAFQ